MTTTVVKSKLDEERDRLLTLAQEDIQRRDQANKLFRNVDLRTYTETGHMQFIGYREKPAWKKDYQYNVWDQVTRDKVMAIISKAGGLYEAQFFNKNKKMARISETVTTVLNGFYKESTDKLDEKERNKEAMLAALISPKAIWHEGWRHQKRVLRDVVERDENGKITKTTARKVVHYSGPWGELVPVEDFVPGSLKERRLQEQPRVHWIPKMQIEDFRRRFPVSRYPRAVDVQPGRTLMDNGLSDYLCRNDLKDNEVEVVHVVEKWDDRLSIIANGILLTEPDSPMPYAHKDYAFVWGGFEPLSPWFCYDMPLTIKLLDMQDVNNEILNLTLDMVWRALNEVILVSGSDSINEDVIYGGGMVDVDNPGNFNKLDFGSSFGFQSANAVMERVKRSIDGASVDAVQQGQAGARPATAREVLVAREAAMEIASLFLGNMEAMERDKARLRVKNQLDRYKNPIDWKQQIGEGLTEEAMPVFRELTARDTKLDGGKRGTVNIFITDKPRPKNELDEINNENGKEMSQTIDISPDVIRNIDFDVEIVGNSSVKRSRAADIAESRAFYGDALQAPDVFNVQYAAGEYVKALGKKTDEALAPKKEQQPGMEGMPGVPNQAQERVPQGKGLGALINEEL